MLKQFRLSIDIYKNWKYLGDYFGIFEGQFEAIPQIEGMLQQFTNIARANITRTQSVPVLFLIAAQIQLRY